MAENKKINLLEVPAFGPAKDVWKAEGNYFSAQELERMAVDFQELKIQSRPRRVYDAN